MNGNLYKMLLMEVRSRLQSVNVFINFHNNCEDVQIELLPNGFRIIKSNCMETIDCDFEIVSNSLNILGVKENWLSFRMATTNANKFGSHKCEFLRSNESGQNGFTSNTTGILPNVDYDLKCMNCTQKLSTINFKRVLPLPSENLELSSWFCHAGDNQKYNLMPGLQDIFYRDEYASMNGEIAKGILQKGSIVYCKRCLAWLGLKKSDKSLKCWFHTISFNEFQTNALEDVFTAIKRSLDQNICRLILDCQSAEAEHNYLLIWVVEKQLKIVLKDKDLSLDESVAKVLFKYENHDSDMVREWQKNLTIHNIEVSKPMMVNLLNILYKMNEYLPRDFAQSNEFIISYLRLNT